MGREIDSAALDVVNLALGIAGTGGSGSHTELLDGDVNQVLSINELVRRAFAVGSTTGIFHCFMDNVHPAAGSLQTRIDPYSPTSLLSQRPYPIIVPKDLDLWWMGCGASVIGTASRLGYAHASLISHGQAQGWGVTNSGTYVSTTDGIFVHAHFPEALGELGNNPALTDQGLTYQPIGIRIRRGQDLMWDSYCSDACTVRLIHSIALMPVALGQDAVT